MTEAQRRQRLRSWQTPVEGELDLAAWEERVAEEQRRMLAHIHAAQEAFRIACVARDKIYEENRRLWEKYHPAGTFTETPPPPRRGFWGFLDVVFGSAD